MRFMIVDTDYGEFIRSLYAAQPGLAEETYERQMTARYASLFGVADFCSCNLRKLGHEAWDVIANLEPAQKQWAREHGVAYPGGKRWEVRRVGGLLPVPVRAASQDWIEPILAAEDP